MSFERMTTPEPVENFSVLKALAGEVAANGRGSPARQDAQKPLRYSRIKRQLMAGNSSSLGG
jgi:hypothetical protein